MNHTLKTLDAEIVRLVDELANESADTEYYDTTHKKLTMLLDSRKHLNPIDMNTVLLVAANLLGIVVVLSYEKVNIVTSKAFSQIMRPR